MANKQQQKAAFSRLAVMPFEVKGLDTETATFWTIASTPELDRALERVSTAAMERAAVDYMKNPVITWQHDTWTPIGKALDVRFEDGATWLQVQLTQKTQDGRDAWGLVQDGIVRSMSIGFNPWSRSNKATEDTLSDYEVTGEELTWTNIEWMETALVTLPCNRGAVIPFAKGLGVDTDRPDAEPEDKQVAEEQRALKTIKALHGNMESLTSIITHWYKEGRAPSKELLDAFAEFRKWQVVMEGQSLRAALVEAYPQLGQETAPGGGLSADNPSILPPVIVPKHGLALPAPHLTAAPSQVSLPPAR